VEKRSESLQKIWHEATLANMKRPDNYTPMTPDELRAALRTLGWTQTELARRTGVSRDSVSRWTGGEVPPPPWCAAYLGAMLDLAALRDRYL
jgi:DNA-binding transcriptional regulator YiaG